MAVEMITVPEDAVVEEDAAVEEVDGVVAGTIAVVVAVTVAAAMVDKMTTTTENALVTIGVDRYNLLQDE